LPKYFLAWTTISVNMSISKMNLQFSRSDHYS